MWFTIVIVDIAMIVCLNIVVRRTNGYKNFYRAIHVMNVPDGEKYDVAAFGSTFSYYAFDLKEYNGHNFSVEPQNIFYMQKTVKHFINNIKENGVVVLALTGCIFASKNVGQEDDCATYHSYLRPKEFDNYKIASKYKYLLNRYFPLMNPHMVKCLIRDTKLYYSISTGISEVQARTHAQNRIKDWERVIGVDDIHSFHISDTLEATMKQTTKVLSETIEYVKQKRMRPVLLILPMSTAFNEVCPMDFYEKILYNCINELSGEGTVVLDYLYDNELSDSDIYWTSDCLNARGRKLMTQRMMEDLRKICGEVL